VGGGAGPAGQVPVSDMAGRVDAGDGRRREGREEALLGVIAGS
jgi:hypothetical protein